MNKIIIAIAVLALCTLTVPSASAGFFDDVFDDMKNIEIPQLSLSDGGFTVNSITTSKIISNDADLASANIILDTTADGGGQSAVGTFSSDSLTQQLADIVIQYPLKIEMSGISEELRYPVRNEGSLFEYQYSFGESVFWQSDLNCPAPKDGAYCFFRSIGDWPNNYYSTVNVKKVAVGQYGRLDNPDIYWKGTAKVTINGIPYSKTIGSAESPGAVEFTSTTGQFVASAKWTGSLVTGQATPSPHLYMATNTGNYWRVSDIKYYSDYTSSLDRSDATLWTWATSAKWCDEASCDDVVNVLSTHNSIVDILTSKSTKITYISATGHSLSQTTNNNVNSGMVVESTSRDIAYPKITWVIKAASLGAFIPVGMPEIVGELSAPVFESGDANGVLSATIKNIGNVRATFGATFTDLSGTFYAITNTASSKITLDPGATGKIIINIGHGSVSSEVSKQATFKVYDVNKPSNSDEKTFLISMKPPKACVPGASRVDGTTVYRCSDDGSAESVVLACGNGILNYIDGKYSCAEVDDSGSKIVTTESPTGGESEHNFDWSNVFWLLVLLAIIYGIYVSGIWTYAYQIPKLLSNPLLLLGGGWVLVVVAVVVIAILLFVLWQIFSVLNGLGMDIKYVLGW